VLHEIESLCAESSQEVSKNKVLFRSTPIEFWVRVLEQIDSKSSSSDENRKTSSILVEILVKGRPAEDFDVESFRRLTDVTVIPVVKSVDAALKLLRYEIRILGDSVAPSFKPGGLSCLQQRCMATLMKELRKVENPAARTQFQREVKDRLRSAHPTFVEILLTDALELESEKVKDADAQVEILTKKLKKASEEVGTLTKKLADAQKALKGERKKANTFATKLRIANDAGPRGARPTPQHGLNHRARGNQGGT
jgi:hypothetical protein